MDSGIINQELYIIGNAIIDESFHTQSADETFFRYFGNDAVYSIKRTIDERDYSEIENAIASASSGITAKTVIRMRGINNYMRWVLVSVCMANDSPERLFSVTFSDVFSLEGLAYSRECRIADYRCVMSLVRDLTFEYDFRTNNIKIYMCDSCREIVITDMNIDVWQKNAINSGYILSRYTETFNNLCNDIKNGTYRFDYEFESSILTNGKNREMYLFRGITRYSDPITKKVTGIISVVSSRQKTKDINLAIEANRDSLSGVLNKQAVTSYAMELLSEKPSCRVNLVLLDIDNFNETVNNFGHMFGDEVIFTVANIIKSEIGARGIVGRVTGEGFLIVLEDTRDETDLRGILRAIRTKTETAFSGRDKAINITCSMGISTYPENSTAYDELFMQADKALYIAHQKGHNRYIIYDIEKHGAVERDISNKIAFLSDKKESSHRLAFLCQLNENLVFGHMPDISVLLEQIRSSFHIDDICIFSGDDMGLILSCGNSSARSAYYILENNYTERFSGDGILAIDNINELESRDDNAFRCLSAQNIGGAFQYLITENNIIKGLISFCYIGHFKKWSDNDINYLTIIGRTVSAILKKQAYI